MSILLTGMVEVTKERFFEIVKEKDLHPSRSGCSDRNLSVWTYRGIAGRVYGITDYTLVDNTHNYDDVKFHVLPELVKA